MRSRYCSALLFLLSACATPEPTPQNQVAVPWAPLVAPRPVALPAPVGLTPPAPVLVDPNAQPQQAPETRPEPTSGREGADRPPPAPLASQRDRDCIPKMTPHRGGDELHDRCADRVPMNEFPGFDVLVNGKHFDALQLHRRILWEVKTDAFDTYPSPLRELVTRKQVVELRNERDLARACRYDFFVGVRSAAHRAELLTLEPDLNIVVMEWC